MNEAQQQQLLDQLAQLQSENDKLKQRAQGNLRMKVSQKGALSVYGLNARFPVTLYAAQWETLISELIDTNAMHDFTDENAHMLARKEGQ